MSAYSVKIRAGNRSLVAIDSFSVAPEKVTFLFGESGIGKSMIAKALYGLLDPDELSVEINGRPYREHLAEPGTRAIVAGSFFVFQEPSSHLNPLMLISEQLNEGSLRGATDEQEVLRRLWETADDTAVRRILQVYPKPYRPSGGEKQRVLLAMAFKKIGIYIRKGETRLPTFFVFDEPTGSLDNHYRNLFLSLLLEKYAQKPFTTLIITHDYSIISEVYARHRELCDRIDFKELSRRDDDSVELHDFSPQEYLGWLAAARPSQADRRAETVLQLASSFRVFGRRLRIHADSAHSRPADLVIRRGEMAYVKAPSGVGKTTLAKVVMGLYEAQQFSMTLAGAMITEKTPREQWSRRIWGSAAGMVFQHADEALDLEATVRETFTGLPLARRLSGDTLHRTLGSLFENITDAFLNKKVKYLSGGQKQRLNLLRTLVLDTRLVILDEPLNALDFGSCRKVLDMIEERRAAGSALLMISHNEEIFDALVDPASVYYLGEVG